VAPAHSLGYFSSNKTMVPRDFEKNTADLDFDLVNLIDPALNLADFGYAPAFSGRHRERARQLRQELPAGAKVLVVHADTKPQKMWLPEYFVNVLDLFLARHPDYVAVVIGETDLGLQTGHHADRVFTRYNLPQLTALSLVGEADLFLGVDSCMLHSADLYGIPGVSLFGPTDPVQWGFRFSRHYRDLRGADGKMENLKPWQVLEALEEVEAEVFNYNYRQLRSVV
jgi:ADP-heptose:LPS heptosyltransferase